MSYFDIIPTDIINVILIKLDVDELTKFLNAFYNIYQNLNYNNLVHLRYGKYTNEILSDFESKKLSYEDYYIIVKIFILKKLFNLKSKLKNIYNANDGLCPPDSKFKNDVYSMITLTNTADKQKYIFKSGNISISDESKLLRNLKLFSQVISTNMLNDTLGDISFQVPEDEYLNEDSEPLSKKEEKKLKMEYNPIFRKLILYYQLDRYAQLNAARVEYIFMNPIRPIDVLDKINEFYLDNASKLEINNALSLDMQDYIEDIIDENKGSIQRYEILGGSNFFEGFSSRGDGSEVNFGS